LLCALLVCVSGHAYWKQGSGTPRIQFCTIPECIATNPGIAGLSGIQGPIWVWPSASLNSFNTDNILKNSCGTTSGTVNYSAAAGYTSNYNSGELSNSVTNPGSAGHITTFWTYGSTQSLTYFINQVHPLSTLRASDGWQIRWRDANSNNNFQVLSVSFAYVTATGDVITQYNSAYTQSDCTQPTSYCTGPFSSEYFVLGNTITVTFVTPTATEFFGTDLEIQFIWTQSGVGLGNGNQAMWLSCTDVYIAAAATMLPTLTVLFFCLFSFAMVF